MHTTGIWHTTVTRQGHILGMPAMRLCTATSANGTYRCLFTAESRPELGAHAFFAKPNDATLVSPLGRQTKLALTPREGYGMTEEAALSDACAEFTRWVGEQMLTSPVHHSASPSR